MSYCSSLVVRQAKPFEAIADIKKKFSSVETIVVQREVGNKKINYKFIDPKQGVTPCPKVTQGHRVGD